MNTRRWDRWGRLRHCLLCILKTRAYAGPFPPTESCRVLPCVQLRGHQEFRLQTQGTLCSPSSGCLEPHNHVSPFIILWKVFNDLFQGVTNLNLTIQSPHIGVLSQPILAALPISSCSFTPKYLTFLQYGPAIHNLIQMLSNHAADALSAQPYPLSLSQ